MCWKEVRRKKERKKTFVFVSEEERKEAENPKEREAPKKREKGGY